MRTLKDCLKTILFITTISLTFGLYKSLATRVNDGENNCANFKFDKMFLLVRDRMDENIIDAVDLTSSHSKENNIFVKCHNDINGQKYLNVMHNFQGDQLNKVEWNFSQNKELFYLENTLYDFLITDKIYGSERYNIKVNFDPIIHSQSKQFNCFILSSSDFSISKKDDNYNDPSVVALNKKLYFQIIYLNFEIILNVEDYSNNKISTLAYDCEENNLMMNLFKNHVSDIDNNPDLSIKKLNLHLLSDESLYLQVGGLFLSDNSTDVPTDNDGDKDEDRNITFTIPIALGTTLAFIIAIALIIYIVIKKRNDRKNKMKNGL